MSVAFYQTHNFLPSSGSTISTISNQFIWAGDPSDYLKRTSKASYEAVQSRLLSSVRSVDFSRIAHSRNEEVRLTVRTHDCYRVLVLGARVPIVTDERWPKDDGWW